MARPNLGSLADPTPISGNPEPDEDDMQPQPGGGTLSPETVGYHDDPQVCGNCKHNQGGNCDVIGQQVNDEGSCRVWEGGGDMDAGMGGGAEPTPGMPMQIGR